MTGYKAMSWNDYLTTILDQYRDKPDDYPLSLGHWEVEPTAIPGIELPKFKAFIRLTVGELKALEADL